MRNWRRAAIVAAAGIGILFSAAAAPSVGASPAADPPPDWAFVPFPPPGPKSPPDKIYTVPGSTLRVTQKRLDDDYFVPDWFPQDHAPMPAVAATGHAPKLWPCAACHGPTGMGGPASAVIAALPAAYIKQQIAEFRAGRRHCAVAKGVPCSEDMMQIAKAASDAEVQTAADYFAHLHYRPRISVVEAAMVPKPHLDGFSLAALPGGGKDAIGARILEMADDPALEHLGDWRSTITAYVPPGSIARGRQLAASGAGATPCAVCHGEGLRGMGAVPPLAGRSPSYLVRQLYDIQYGFRKGPAVALMQPEVAHLNADDRIAIAAYLASLPAQGHP